MWLMNSATPLALLGVLIGLPLLNALLFRVNAIFLFVSIAVGNLLVQFLGDDVILAVNAFSRSQNVPMIVNLSLQLAPVVMTLFILRKSVPPTKMLLHLLPLVGCCLMIAVLALPLLPLATQEQIFALPLGDVFKQSQDLVVAITAVMILALTWRSYRPHDGKHGKRSKH